MELHNVTTQADLAFARAGGTVKPPQSSSPTSSVAQSALGQLSNDNAAPTVTLGSHEIKPSFGEKLSELIQKITTFVKDTLGLNKQEAQEGSGAVISDQRTVKALVQKRHEQVVRLAESLQLTKKTNISALGTQELEKRLASDKENPELLLSLAGKYEAAGNAAAAAPLLQKYLGLTAKSLSPKNQAAVLGRITDLESKIPEQHSRILQELSSIGLDELRDAPVYSKGPEQPLNNMEQLAVRVYTSSFYKLMNAVLSKNEDAVKDYFNEIGIRDPSRQEKAIKLAEELIPIAVRGLDKIPTLNEGTTVFRGACLTSDLLEKYKPNEVVSCERFTSTSTSMNASHNFIIRETRSDRAKVMFTIMGNTGKPISKYSQFSNESEVLFPPNASFKVVARGQPDAWGITRIALMEV